MALEVIILAAGKGTRMKSNLPKVMHELAGYPMVYHVIKTALLLKPKKIHLVIGHGKEQIRDYIQSLDNNIKDNINLCVQEQQLGTAHAVASAIDKVDNKSDVLVLYADCPLVPLDVLEQLYAYLKDDNDLVLLSAQCEDPFGYGRIIRNNKGEFKKIVEQKDATDKEQLITEINTGIMAFSAQIFKQYFKKIHNSNKQQEYYLTDLPELLVKDKKKVQILEADDFELLQGVNDKIQLSIVESLYQQNQNMSLMAQGLTLLDPNRFDVRGHLKFGKDCVIDINVLIIGEVILADNVYIGPGCILKNVTIGANSKIDAYTIIENTTIKENCTLGPFARFRPGNIIENNVHVGNFVEVKNSHLNEGTKSGHLSYLGDSVIGKNVNIGAGCITCNYDGANKHKTIIGDDVFVGSDCQLVAPVKVEDNSTIGAGSTVTKTVPKDSLYITRASARIIDNYQRPKKNKA